MNWICQARSKRMRAPYASGRDSLAWHRSRKLTFPERGENWSQPLDPLAESLRGKCGKMHAIPPKHAPAGGACLDDLEAVLIRVAVVDKDGVEAGDASPAFDGGDDGLVVAH